MMNFLLVIGLLAFVLWAVYQDTPCAGQPRSTRQDDAARQPLKNVQPPSEVSKYFEAQIPAAAAKAAAAKAAYAKEQAIEANREPPPLTVGTWQFDVERLWGSPSRTSKSVTAMGTIEIWHYPRGRYMSQSLTFHDGKLVNITSLQH
jgi:cytoskeletal protein RodZ